MRIPASSPEPRTLSTPSTTGRALLAIAAAALAWSAIVALSGGFQVRIAGVPLSSRDASTALVVAVVAAIAGAALTWRSRGCRAATGEWLRLRDAAAARTMRSWRRVREQASTVTADAREREPWLALAPALAVASAGVAVAVTQWLEAPPFWLDEEMILLNVRDRSSTGLGGALWLGQSAPLAWLAAERAALVTIGPGEAALRLVPLLFGLATVGAAVWIAHRWMTSLGGAILVLLCAFAPFVSHYFFETKHYSADTFWALLLPALAAWAIDGARPETRARRALAWWTVAAVGQTVANGALLVAPGCALVLVLWSWRRDGTRAAVRVALIGSAFLVVFAAHYLVSLRFTHDSEFLRTYWQNEVPPASSGPFARLGWVGDRLPLLAENPAGTRFWRSLWIVSALGLAMSLVGRTRSPARRLLAVAFATAPLTAFLLAAMRLVPLYQRFSIWIVPALYVGVALSLDAAVHAVRDARRRRRWTRAAATLPVAAAALVVSADIHARGVHDIANIRPSESKHALNDRYAVEWLMARLQPGDALMTTRLGWPAVWWYGNISIANADPDGAVSHPHGIALLQAEHSAPGPDCDDALPGEQLKDYRRVLVYVGFRDQPPGFDYLLLDALDRIGAIKAFSRYSELGLAAVIDLDDRAATDRTLPAVSPKTVEAREPLEGCVRVQPARRW